ncbi:MAG TPA: ribonuclease Y [Longimicrobiales bacterium]|nr:ribonuclease Y [Longimicrobiales bacterium]
MSPLLIGAVAVGALLLGLLLGYGLEHQRLRRRKADAESEAARLIAAARQDVEQIQRVAELSGKEEAYRARQEWEREETRRREEVERSESRVEERRSALDRKYDVLLEKNRQLDEREKELETRGGELDRLQQEAQRIEHEARRRLESLAGLTAEEALRKLMQGLEDEARARAANSIREIKENARREAEREAKNIIALAILRIAADHTAESTVSVVSLPSDEMKGRIIGREGRNIRAFEQTTGVDVIIDDTPEAVILSAFDPIRRETARLALEKLVSDGRIHPGRIEEVVEKSRREVEEGMVQAAEETLYQLGIHGVHPEVVKVLGRLKYRTSYGQNQLLHSREVAIVAGNMAAEMGLDATVTRRMALLHDVGKGLTHEHEGTHVELGWNLCKKYGEPDQVLNAIKAHHDEEPHRYAETFLVTAADAVSGARPGARREMFETYVKRLEKLEQIANGFEGVERCFAIQAGREVRVMVNPENVDDAGMTELSDRIARRLEEELQYPGQIKVMVIRETRAVDFAR